MVEPVIADFVLMPNEVLWHPPVKHRHTSYWARHLTPMMVYILGGVLIAARAALAEQRHTDALAAGAGAMAAEVADHEAFKAAWRRKRRAAAKGVHVPAPMRLHQVGHGTTDPLTRKPRPIREALLGAGRGAYRAALERLRREPVPEGVQVAISRRQLLRLAGCAPDAGNYRAVEASLNRLCRSVGAGGCEMPGVLRDWEELPGGRLQLVVDGRWLPPCRYKQVPWPPPKRSPAALALYLLLHVLDTRPMGRREVSPEWFAARLGLDPRAGTGKRNWSINAAFTGVNAMLDALPDEVVSRLHFMRRRMSVPQEYTVKPITRGKVRVVAVPRVKVYDPEAAATRPMGRTPPCRGPRIDPGKSAGVLGSAGAAMQGSSDLGTGVFGSANRGEPVEKLTGFADLGVAYNKDV